MTWMALSNTATGMDYMRLLCLSYIKKPKLRIRMHRFIHRDRIWITKFMIYPSSVSDSLSIFALCSKPNGVCLILQRRFEIPIHKFSCCNFVPFRRASRKESNYVTPVYKGFVYARVKRRCKPRFVVNKSAVSRRRFHYHIWDANSSSWLPIDIWYIVVVMTTCSVIPFTLVIIWKEVSWGVYIRDKLHIAPKEERRSI